MMNDTLIKSLLSPSFLSFILCRISLQTNEKHVETPSIWKVLNFTYIHCWVFADY